MNYVTIESRETALKYYDTISYHYFDSELFSSKFLVEVGEFFKNKFGITDDEILSIDARNMAI